MNKLLPIIIRIIVFFAIYFPLATIPFYLKISSLFGMMAFVALFASKPATNYILKKYFSKKL